MTYYLHAYINFQTELKLLQDRWRNKLGERESERESEREREWEKDIKRDKGTVIQSTTNNILKNKNKKQIHILCRILFYFN